MFIMYHIWEKFPNNPVIFFESVPISDIPLIPLFGKAGVGVEVLIRGGLVAESHSERLLQNKLVSG